MDNRDFGDCPGNHCCSKVPEAPAPKIALDTTCWSGGSDMASRDASCQGDLVCARQGFDGRDFGDCPNQHCCSVLKKQRLDTTCWAAGSDKASRDASCATGLVCAKSGYDDRDFGDCPNQHCCSLLVRERFDATCWDAGSDTASRDASCATGLVCARLGFDGRDYGDCPERHCCSVEVIASKVIYSVGVDKKIYEQMVSKMGTQSPWSLAGKGPMTSITVNGDTMYGIGKDQQVYKQLLSSMGPSSNWTLAARGKILSTAIDGDTIYGVADDKQVYRQALSTMTPYSAWSWASKGDVTSIAIDGDTIYGVGNDHLVYKQTLSTMHVGWWSLAGAGFVQSIAIDAGNIYGTGISNRVWRQALSTLTPTSDWSLAAAGDVLAVAFSR